MEHIILGFYLEENISCNMELNSHMPIDKSKTRELNNKSFNGSTNQPRTARSFIGTEFYSTPFIESKPGSVFTKEDLNFNIKLNLDWDILSKKYFDLSNQTTVQGEIKENFSNQHNSLFGKFIIQIPLYDKLESKNGLDLFFNYKYKKIIQ